MAQIPYSPVPTVEPQTGLPNDYQNIQARPDAFGAAIAQGVQQAGVGTLKAAHFYGEVAADQSVNNWQDEVNHLLYGDPTTGDVGVYGLKGQAGMEAAATVGDRIAKLRDKYRNQLSTPEQQLTFDSYTRRTQNYLMSEIGRHYDQQASLWATEVGKASDNLALQHISQHADDPEQVNHGTADLMTNRLKQLQITAGLNPPNELMDSTMLDARRDAATAQIRSLMADPAKVGLANQVFQQNRKLFKGTPAEDALSNALETHADRAAADAAFQRALGNGPVGGGDLWSRVKGAEGGVGPGGEARVSSAGAVGISQILPETARGVAADMGVPFDEQRLHTDQAYNEALGKRYLQDQLQRFGGNETLAAAAYNAGPERVEQWTKTIGDPRKGEISNAAFASRIPIDETRAYTMKVAGQQYAQAGPLTATDAGTAALASGKPDYAAAVARVRADPTLSARARTEALTMLHSQYTFDHDLESRAEAEAAKQLKNSQTEAEAQLFAQAVRKEPLDPQMLSRMVQSRQITPQGYNAIMGEVARAAEPGQNDWDTVMHLSQRQGAGEDVTQDIYSAAQQGKLKGETAETLLRAQNTRNKEQTDQVQRTAFSTLRTIAGMDAQEHPMVDLAGQAKADQVALWAQAQTEWNKRVIVNKENPMDVLADMTPRYGQPVQSINALPHPRLGTIIKPEDVVKVKDTTQAAFDAGQLSREQFRSEQELILRYQDLFAAQQKRDAARQAVPPRDRSGGGARAVGVKPEGQ